MPESEGWSWLISTGTGHYFRAGRSLCGRWILRDQSGSSALAPFDTAASSAAPGECPDCWRKRAEKAKTQP
jgi:hypothetical protein